MRYFYEMYPDVGNRQQAVDDLKQSFQKDEDNYLCVYMITMR